MYKKIILTFILFFATPQLIFAQTLNNGDINQDGSVNILDYQILANNFGQTNAQADINQDGSVNILDYQILANNFGQTNNSPTPTPSTPQLTISHTDTDVILSWTPDPQATSYRIHYVTNPTQISYLSTELTTVDANTTTYTHQNVISPGINHYYGISAINSSTEYNQAAANTYQLESSPDRYALIALPFATNITNPQDLLSQIPSLYQIRKWDPNTSAFIEYTIDNPSNPAMNLSQGDVFFISNTNDSPGFITFSGTIEPHQFNIIPSTQNFVYHSFQRGYYDNAQALAADIGPTSSLLQWNTTTQAFRIFVPPSSGDNFISTPGTPLIINASDQTRTTWPLENPESLTYQNEYITVNTECTYTGINIDIIDDNIDTQSLWIYLILNNQHAYLSYIDETETNASTSIVDYAYPIRPGYPDEILIEPNTTYTVGIASGAFTMTTPVLDRPITQLSFTTPNCL